MTWHWPTIYICIGLIGMLLTDESVQGHDPDNPIGTRVLMSVFWPLVIMGVIFFIVWYWFDPWEDDD